MAWTKLGRIFKTTNNADWMSSYSSVPFALPLNKSIVRIFFSPRDYQNRSYIAWLEIDINEPTNILRLSTEPFLIPGLTGTFDDCGVMPSWISKWQNEYIFYYIGWNVRNTVPFHQGLGKIRFDSLKDVIGEVTATNAVGPFMDRSEFDPFYVTNPCIIQHEDQLMMWYLSGIGWFEDGEELKSKYVIKLATSKDGETWCRSKQPIIGLKDQDEIALARPSVLVDDEGFHMWFSYRSKEVSYRIGYAYSPDGVSWQRNSEYNDAPNVSLEGWDSHMIAYPHVFQMGKTKYMLYCGNNWSKEGFGIARYD